VEDPRVGRILQGRYKLISQLAEGGMGVVYRAERVGIGRPVVVKFLHAMLSDKPGIVDRFEREARATAVLNHPNCVALVDFGIEEGAPFLVMELAEGQTLADMLDHGPLPPPRAVAIIRQVLAGLQHAHARGILHRDLKPANIMICDAAGVADFVKILDFGLAKMLDPTAYGNKDVTVEGIAIGTPGYMSPEQAAGIPSDRRADIYCTGALLYHMVTGAKAFDGEDLHSVLRRHREETPAAPRDVVPQVKISPELEAVIFKAMRREPSERYQTVDEMAASLRATPEGIAGGDTGEHRPIPLSRAVEHSTKAEMPSSRARERRSAGAARAWMLLFGGVVVGVAGTVVGLSWFGGPDPHPPPLEHPLANKAAVDKTAAAVEKPAVVAPAPVEKAAAPVEKPADLAAPPLVAPAATPPPLAAVAIDAGAARAEAADEDDGADEDDRAPPPEVPAAPRREMPQVHTLADVRALLKKGDADGALAGLYRLRRARPAPAPRAAAEIASLIGNLYFDRRWWTDALKEYRFAVTLDAREKGDVALVANAVRSLGDKQTYPRGRRLILYYVGRGAAPALRRAIKSGASPLARKNAQTVLTLLEGKGGGARTKGKGR
jgi:serine/threonine-protein kinase